MEEKSTTLALVRAATLVLLFVPIVFAPALNILPKTDYIKTIGWPVAIGYTLLMFACIASPKLWRMFKEEAIGCLGIPVMLGTFLGVGILVGHFIIPAVITHLSGTPYEIETRVVEKEIVSRRSLGCRYRLTLNELYEGCA